MPQLDLYSYFSAATALIILFIALVFILHTYMLPKLATVLKFRNKIQAKNNSTGINTMEEKPLEEPFLEIAHTYINELEKVAKQTQK